jgi:hypothetical protein
MARGQEAPASSTLEWWAVAAILLSAAFVYALTQPAVGRPPPGFPTFIALSVTILGCALEAAAIGRRVLANRPAWVRTIASAVAFGVVVAGGILLIGRAPGSEVLLGWIVAPPAIGTCAVASAGRRGSWSALAFLVATGILVVLLGRRWVGG